MQEKCKFLCLWLLVGWLMSAQSALGANDEALYIMPYEQAQAIHALKTALKSARSEIAISIYSFTNNELAKAIRDSAKRGVKVHIIYDKESNIKNNASTIGYLAKYNNISVCLLSGMRAKNGKFYGIMHQKMAIIDNELLILGSANWSKNAFENNFETLFFTHNSALVAKAKHAYEQMKHNCVGF